LDSRNDEILNLIHFNVNVTPKSSMSVTLPDESVYSECMYIPCVGEVGPSSVVESIIEETRHDSVTDGSEDKLYIIAQHFIAKVIYECVSLYLGTSSITATMSTRLKSDSANEIYNNAMSTNATRTFANANDLSITAVAIPTLATERRKPHKSVESRQIIMAGVYNDEKKQRPNPKAADAGSKATRSQFLSFLDPLYT